MGTPPVPHRRRTSSGSSGSACGTSPPTANWTVSPSSHQPWSVSPRSSPLRHSRSSGRFTPPSLPPILGSPNTWAGTTQPMAVAVSAVDNNNVLLCRANSTEMSVRPASASVATARNTVVLNYSPSHPGSGGLFSHHHSAVMTSARRSSGSSLEANNKENQCPLPPPDLSEETLLAPEHNEVLSKLRFISMLVDTIIGRFLQICGSGSRGLLDPDPGRKKIKCYGT